ncbi:MAG: hypothetical protein GXO91_08105 [FCB group bacterium]|nr:hypothetical protein [FCB group bacterium]
MKNFVRLLGFVILPAVIYPGDINSLCGLPVTEIPLTQQQIIGSLRDCPDGEIFFVRSNVESQNPTFDEVCFYLVSTTSVASIYVEADRYDAGDITDAAIAQIENVFNQTTVGADLPELQQGIFSAELQIFGPPPVIDGSDLVNILLLDVRDNFAGTGNYIGGYFDPNDQTDNPTSNQKNIIYIDCDPVDLTSSNPEEALFTLAHEFQHLLHYAADPTEHEDGGNYNPWLDEGLSDLAASVLGLGHRNYGYYLSDTSIGLDQWVGNGLEYYAKSALFFQYFYETEGIEAVTAIFEDDQYSRIESLKNYLGPANFDDFFTGWVQATISGNYSNGDCIFGIAPQSSLISMVQVGENEIFLEENNNFNPYSSWHVAIPSVAEKSDIVDLQPLHSTDLLYNLREHNFITADSENEWFLNYIADPLIFSKIIYNSAPTLLSVYFHLGLEVGLNELQYDEDILTMYLNYDSGRFYAVNEFPISGQALITGAAFRVGNDASVTLKIKKRGITYTPSYSRTLCAPIGPGWTTIDLLNEGIFIDNAAVYVELETDDNALGYSNAFPENHSGADNQRSYYSVNGTSYNSITSLSVGGQSLQGNWAIRLFYADSSQAHPTTENERLSLHPNPYLPGFQNAVETQVQTRWNEHISLRVYNIYGQEIISLYEGTPPPDTPVTLNWSGKDHAGNNVSSGIYFFKERIGDRQLTAKLLLLR